MRGPYIYIIYMGPPHVPHVLVVPRFTWFKVMSVVG